MSFEPLMRLPRLIQPPRAESTKAATNPKSQPKSHTKDMSTITKPFVLFHHEKDASNITNMLLRAIEHNSPITNTITSTMRIFDLASGTFLKTDFCCHEQLQTINPAQGDEIFLSHRDPNGGPSHGQHHCIRLFKTRKNPDGVLICPERDIVLLSNRFLESTADDWGSYSKWRYQKNRMPFALDLDRVRHVGVENAQSRHRKLAFRKVGSSLDVVDRIWGCRFATCLGGLEKIWLFVANVQGEDVDLAACRAVFPERIVCWDAVGAGTLLANGSGCLVECQELRRQVVHDLEVPFFSRERIEQRCTGDRRGSRLLADSAQQAQEGWLSKFRDIVDEYEEVEIILLYNVDESGLVSVQLQA